jgi:GNAT superfamily N-acetyltransferase
MTSGENQDGAGSCSYRLRPPGTTDDWNAYHQLRRDVLLESMEHAIDNTDDDEHCPDHFPLLFWLDERPIGTIRVDCLEGGRAAMRLVAIDPGCQGQGHGRQLLREAESFARRLGCRRAVVYATPEAAGFYARGGYAEEEWDECCMGGIVQMAKALP